MKKNVKITVANPAGNKTIFVHDSFERESYAAVAEQLLAMKDIAAEQVAFILFAPECGRAEGRMEMCGLEFCGNATRAFGLMVARDLGIAGEGHVFLDVSGTGFSTADSNLWPSMSIVILLGCSLVCGCSGSTSGGMKFDRLLVCYKSVRAKLTTLANPSQVNVVKVDGRAIPENRVSDLKTYMAIYFFLIAIGALVNTGFGMDLVSGFSASLACLSNVGPGFGQVGVMNTYDHLPWVLKVFNAFIMLLGRLEIFSLFYVLRIQPKR